MDDNSSQSNDLVEIVDESPPPSPPPRSLSPACIRRHKRLNEPDVYCLAPAAIEASSSQVLNEQLGLVVRILQFLPRAVQSCARSWFPEWFLPDTLILKRQRPYGDASASEEVLDKDLSDEYFDVELKAYQRLGLLQAHVVPKLFGPVTINGSRGLLLQDVGGVSLTEPEGALLSLEELARLLDNCLSSLTALGVLHGDAHPANFRLVKGHLIALDFEMSEFDLSAEDNAFFTKCEIIQVGERYQEVRRLLWFEGLLQSESDKSA